MEEVTWTIFLVGSVAGAAVPRGGFFLQLVKNMSEETQPRIIWLDALLGRKLLTPGFHHTSFFNCYCHCRKGISKCQAVG